MRRNRRFIEKMMQASLGTTHNPQSLNPAVGLAEMVTSPASGSASSGEGYSWFRGLCPHRLERKPIFEHLDSKEESPVRKHKVNMPQPRRRDDPGHSPGGETTRGHSPDTGAESQMLTVPENCIGKKRTTPSELTALSRKPASRLMLEIAISSQVHCRGV